jgi:hypothetical protein
MEVARFLKRRKSINRGTLEHVTENNIDFVRFEVFTAVTMKNAVL